MFKKSILFLSFCLLIGSSAWAQGYPVVDTGDIRERSCNPKSYTDLGNGIIRDEMTGLEWDRWGASGIFIWREALDYCSGLMLGGHTDWRLPSVEELATLMDAGSDDPVIAPVFFSYSDSYWTSTAFAGDSKKAYFVDFGAGNTGNDLRMKSFNVRGVRGLPAGGQPCSNDLDCESGEECIYDMCVPSTVQPCSNDLDCGPGEECIDEMCVPSAGQPCSSDLDCDLDEECIDEMCVSSTGQPCSNDLDCDSGEECIDEMCVSSVEQPAVNKDRFITNGDGTVTDNTTDLIWAQCAYGQTWDNSQCMGDHQALTWDEALAHVAALNALNYLGYDDWRLPTRNELESIMDRMRLMPATTFPDMGPAVYWSSTNNAFGEVWAVCFYLGKIFAEVSRKELFTMRAVRGGACMSDGVWCLDDGDCAEGYVCTDDFCVEDQCELYVKHKPIRSVKITKPKKVVLKITGEEGFDVFGTLDLGPLTWVKSSPNSKKGTLKVKGVAPVGLEPGIISIRVGDCIGSVEVQ